MTGQTQSTPPLSLIHRSLIGDQEAFEQIFHAYKNLVYKTAFLMLGNNEDAEDILQSVFIRVYKSLDTYDASKGAFTTWLYRITVNHCHNFRRKHRFTLLSFTRQLENLMVSQTGVEKQFADNDALEHALSNLGEKLRAVVILRYYWDMSYAEIATSLDIPLGTVKSRLSQALIKLGEAMDDPITQNNKEMAK